MIRRTLFFIAILTITIVTGAQNPIICDRYTPDPAPYVHGDTLYLFVDHDENETQNGYFTMKDWLLYSTVDMVNWTYRGTPLTSNTFSAWAKQDNDCWASQCIERNGKWYWYVTATIKGQAYPGIGVAVADSPAGPYHDPIGQPLVQGWFRIDPTVMIDDDGQAYLFYGNNMLWYARLSNSMTSIIGGENEVVTKDENAFGPFKGYNDDGSPKTNFEEASWIYKRNGKYYLEYAAGGVPEHWAYSTADNITGPWTYRGRILGQANNSFTIHGGSVEFRGHHYMFYHNGNLPGGGGYKRATCVEEFTPNADGSIPAISFTSNGVAPLQTVNPFVRQEGETINQCQGVLCEGNYNGCYVTNISAGDYIKVRNVAFGTQGAKSFHARIRSNQSGVLVIRTGSTTGDIKGQLTVESTGGAWTDVACDLTSTITGTNDLFFTFEGSGQSLFDLDFWRFDTLSANPQGETEVPGSYAVGDDIVSYAPASWAGQTAVFNGTVNGHTAYERYNNGSIGQGDVLTQTLTGVKSGTYNVTLELAGSFTPDRGFTCPTGTGLSLAFVNDQFRNLEVVERGWVSSVEPLTVSVTVSEGTLRYGIYNISDAGNWYTANVTSIQYVSANTDNSFNVNTSAQHGTLTASTAKTAAGTTVTLGATPDANYQFDSYTVTTCTGEAVTLNGNSFVMPAADVNVTANFSLSYEVGDDIVAIAPAEWAGQSGVFGGQVNGHTAYERYKHGASNGAGDVLTQTLTGLKNGIYAVTLELAASFTSGRDFECPTGDGLSVAFANGAQENLTVVDRGWVSSVTPITLYATVTDGTLKYGIRNLQESGNWYLANVTGIQYISASTTLTHELTVSDAGMATLYLPFGAAVPDADFFVVATVKDISGTTANLKEIRGGVIPAKTGVLIFANPGTYTLSLSSTSSNESVESLMHGVLEDTSVKALAQQEGKSIYVLSRGIKEYMGFKKATGDGTVKTIPAYRAYLPIGDSSEVNFITFSFGGDNTTGIDALRDNTQEQQAEIFDLTGRKVTAPEKGIYIINGKKVLYKP